MISLLLEISLELHTFPFPSGLTLWNTAELPHFVWTVMINQRNRKWLNSSPGVHVLLEVKCVLSSKNLSTKKGTLNIFPLNDKRYADLLPYYPSRFPESSDLRHQGELALNVLLGLALLFLVLWSLTKRSYWGKRNHWVARKETENQEKKYMLFEPKKAVHRSRFSAVACE